MTVHYPDDDTVAETVARSPRKTSPEWERILLAELRTSSQPDQHPATAPTTAPPSQARTNDTPLPGRLNRTTLVNPFTRTPPPTHTDTPPTTDDTDEIDTDLTDYEPPAQRRPADLNVGDLINLDGDWVHVHEEPVDAEDTIEITWRDLGTIETTALSPDETIPSRRPAA